ncbi:MAG: maltose alpha-D-glucosyltransferase [Vulcanimicrobiota bacterium]
MKKTRVLFICLVILSIMVSGACFAQQNNLDWLESQSMLFQGKKLAEKYSGSKKQWQHAYTQPHPEKLCEMASVWFTAYPASTITPTGKTIIQTLGSDKLWEAFEKIGIEAMHTSPLKRAGGVKGREFTPTVDGGFDRIGLDMAPEFGTDEQYRMLVQTAKKHKGYIAGDIVPGHTGKGPDFRLAARNYKNYPGLYSIIEIKRKDWDILPELADDVDTQNLDMQTVEELYKRGYIPGKLQRVIFYEKGVKETNWSVTNIVTGADGEDRRWVYLHYFKEGQPTLNWLDPSFAAQQLIAGDVIKTVDVLGAKIIRLDANGFLGIEKTDSFTAWSQGHPLSIIATEYTAMLSRKMGGFSFQELNLNFEDIKKFSQNGPDLSYDFITRPAYCHALLTGDASFLKLTLNLMHEYKIKPISLIHALQNHDEITYELVHFSAYGNEKFDLDGKMIEGKKLRSMVVKQMKELATAPEAPYNKLSGNGLCTTFAGYCSAALGIENPYNMAQKDREQVIKAHMLLATFNAMQPGVFALSGWDMVGALPLPQSEITEMVADGDFRWVNRGAYDLMGNSPEVDKSTAGMPRAMSLYGSIPEQLKDKNSFLSRLQKILAIRKNYKIHLSEQMPLPQTNNKAVVMMVHKLPHTHDYEITALNFAQKRMKETTQIGYLKDRNIIDLNSGKQIGVTDSHGKFSIEFNELEGKILLFKK